MWEHHPSHVLLVLAVALINVALALVASEAAHRRADARLFLVSLALITSSGFLALHALATPGVLLDHPNSGFVIATPILIGQATYDAVRDEVTAEPIGDFDLKGKPAPVPTFEVRVDPAASA